MKKRTLKKLATTMAIGLLFSTTAVFGANGNYYSISLSPTQTDYTILYAKQVTGDSKIEQQSPQTVIEYRVVNSANVAKTGSVTITNINTGYAKYNVTVDVGDMFKLRAYNDPAKNQGSIRNARGYWTP